MALDDNLCAQNRTLTYCERPSDVHNFFVQFHENGCAIVLWRERIFFFCASRTHSLPFYVIWCCFHCFLFFSLSLKRRLVCVVNVIRFLKLCSLCVNACADMNYIIKYELVRYGKYVGSFVGESHRIESTKPHARSVCLYEKNPCLSSHHSPNQNMYIHANEKRKTDNKMKQRKWVSDEKISAQQICSLNTNTYTQRKGERERE